MGPSISIVLTIDSSGTFKPFKKFEFISNLNDALNEVKSMEYNGPKVVFGSHYIAKKVFNFFDFSDLSTYAFVISLEDKSFFLIFSTKSTNVKSKIFDIIQLP